MEKAAYDCKVCGKGGVVSYDETCPDLHLNVWLPQLSCNRCADFERGWLKAMEEIKTLAFSISPIRKPAPDQAARAGEAIRSLVQRGCDSVSDYLGMQRSADRELLDECGRNPDAAHAGLAWFRTKAFKQAGWKRKTQTEIELPTENP